MRLTNDSTGEKREVVNKSGKVENLAGELPDSFISGKKRWREKNRDYMREWRKQHIDAKRKQDAEYRRRKGMGIRVKKILTTEQRKETARLAQRKQLRKYREKWMELIIIPRGWDHCKRCGYKKCFAAIEFHHRDPKTKEASFRHIWNKPITDKRIKEFEKTDPLCANCHREIHDDVRNGRI